MYRPVALVCLGAALTVIPCGSTSLADDVGFAGWQSDANQAWRSAQAAQRPLLLYITTENCLYCRKMERESWSNRVIAEDVRREFVAANVNAGKNAELVRKLNVRVYPTTVIISPSKGIVEHITGYVPPRELHIRLAAAVHRSESTPNIPAR